MKKLFVFAVAAATVLAGCSNDKQVEGKGPGAGNGIDFRPVTKKNTRATEIDATNIRDFKAFGFWSGSYEFMYDVNVVRGDGDTWSYAPLRYWPSTGTPANDNIDFYAYSPAGSRGVVVADMFAMTDTDPVISYVVPTAAGLQEDFLVATKAAQNKSVAAGTVELLFDHALTQAVFEARSVVQDVIFNVSAIEITGMQTNGELDLSTYATTGWDLSTAPAYDVYSAPIATLPIIYNNTTPAVYTRISGPNDGLIILPQPLTKLGDGVDADKNNIPDDYEADAETIYLVVTYSAQLNSGAVIVPAGTKVYLKLSSVPNTEFEMGKKYIFQLDMSTGLTPIVFNVVGVNDWVNETVTL